MTFRQIKRLLKSIKKIEKVKINQKKLIYFDYFDHDQSLSISLSIYSNLFNIFQTDNNQFFHNELQSGFNFGSKSINYR